MKLSIIIPAYNEAKRIRKNVEQVLSFLKRHYPSYEVIVVDDGSRDGTAQEIDKIKNPHLTLISYMPNEGKGHAVKKGMLSATGDALLFLDADLSLPIEQIQQFLPYLMRYDIVIGSKAIGSTVKWPWHRRLFGRVFNLFVWILTGLPFKDTQCGFKLFSRRAADAIFPRVYVNRFGFDVEILFLARKFRMRIKELPVTLNMHGASSVSVLRTSWSMLKDILSVRWRDLMGRYRQF